ncbi:DUF5682 family protein, partial [Nonomuraea zeae]
ALGEARGKGTFRETWTLQWRPEHDLALIEHAALGTTVASAAAQRARDLAGAERAALADLTSLVELCLLAELPEALPEVLAALSAKAALDTDVTHLMAALPAMVRAHRYGDVRGTSAEGLAVIVRSMLERICVGLPVAVTGLDDDAAADLLKHVDAVHTAVALLADADADADAAAPPGGARASAGTASEGAASAGVASAETASGGEEGAAGGSPRSRWLVTLRGVSDRQDLHGLIEGRLTRILLDSGELQDAGDRMSRAMSSGQTPARAAAWVEGFLSGGGLLLVHDPRLLALVDGWLTGLSGDQFTDVLPLLRRTFGGFAVPERRAVGERLRSAGRGRPEAEQDVDERRAAAAVATVLSIIGRDGG